MKKYRILVAAVLMTTTLASCKKECDCPTKTSEVETTVTTREATSADDAMSAKEEPSGTTVAAPSKRTGKTSGTRRTTAKSEPYLSNPAPDGTNAENYDDDYYSRNDTTHRPTGTSIR